MMTTSKAQNKKTSVTPEKVDALKSSDNTSKPSSMSDTEGNGTPKSEATKRHKRNKRVHYNRYVLIVDDDVYALDEMAETLRDFSLTPLLAANPSQALEKAKKYRPKIVILDFSLPEMNGLDLLDEMRKFLPKAGYFMISGDSTFCRVANSNNTKTLAVLEKPVSVSEIARFIRTIPDMYPTVAK